MTLASATPGARTTPDRGLPIYPIALGAALFFQVVATSGVGFWVSLRPFAIVLVVVVALTAAIRLALGDSRRAGPAAAFVVLGILFGDDRILLLSVIVLAMFLVERRVIPGRLELPWPAIDRAGGLLAAIAAIAILIQSVQVGAYPVLVRSIVDEGPLRSFNITEATAGTHPDIYVILLDGYARHDALDQVFDVDDTPLLRGLEARGLTVSTRARTSYAFTVQVLMSMFHASLLSDIAELRPILNGTYSGTEIGLTHAVVQQNPVFDELRAAGYEIDGISSGFAQISLRESDRFIDSGQINEFEVALLRRTVAGDLVNLLAPDFVPSQQRDRIWATFATLGRIAAERPGHPRFVFAHVPSPHPPWVFNADGSPRASADIHTIYEEMPDTTGLDEGELKAAYSGSVQALWQPVLDAIDAVDRASAAPPVIVVFGDHGSWVGALPGDARLRFLPLLAARVPGSRDPLAGDEDLVNVFPDLLNPLLGTALARVDPSPSFMFGSRDQYDLHAISDPNMAIVPGIGTPLGP
jgi:hypothetical protein